MQTVIVNIILYYILLYYIILYYIIYRVVYTILKLIIHMNYTSKNKLK